MEIEKVQLESGRLRMSALACGQGPVVLCLHGFPDHNRSFRHQLPALAAAGYRAVAPMMRGYEPSSQPGPSVAAHHPLHLATDVLAWARDLGRDDPVDLVGHDWGGIVGFLACQLEPSLFRSYCSVAVPSAQAMEDGVRSYPGQLRNSWYILFFQLRGLSDRVVAANDYAFLERLWRDWSPGWQWERAEMDALKTTFRQPGVLWSSLAYYRATLHPLLPESKRMRAMTRDPVPVRTLTVTGSRDGCMDTRLFDCADAAQFPQGLRIERIEDAGHFAHQERPDLFNELLLGWLAEQATAR